MIPGNIQTKAINIQAIKKLWLLQKLLNKVEAYFVTRIKKCTVLQQNYEGFNTVQTMLQIHPLQIKTIIFYSLLNYY